MRRTQFFIPTLKEIPADAEIISHRLMLRAGMIRKLASGLYTWLPLGLRILRKVELIIREEMNRTGAQEILMPVIQPAELWKETDRWDKFGPELLKIKDRHKREYCFGPTHEEVVTDLLRYELHSYKQLPLTVYQIQTKFRDEIRPRFGIMRAREFLMKDAYSFHVDSACLSKTYQAMHDSYTHIFTRLGLKFRAVMADSGSIGGNYSEEFHVLSETGEDKIYYEENTPYAYNVEVAEKMKAMDAGRILHQAKGIEVGHIFQLGNTYSLAMRGNINNKDGHSIPLEMGCYGIGVSRIVAAAIEQSHDEQGMIWPIAMAPFQFIILPIGYKHSKLVQETADTLYQALSVHAEVLLDDRDERAGVMFVESELIGIPHQIVISDRSLKENLVEYKNRSKQITQSLKANIEDLITYFLSLNTQ